jgi:histidine ammonia-lyase
LTLSHPTTGTVTLTGDDLSIEDVVSVARRGARVEVSREALDRVRRARDVVDRVLERGDLVYGAYSTMPFSWRNSAATSSGSS